MGHHGFTQFRVPGTNELGNKRLKSRSENLKAKPGPFFHAVQDNLINTVKTILYDSAPLRN